MRTCNEHEITIEQLMNVVHNYTDPIRISVVMGDAWLTCEEARHMRDFYLTERYSYTDREEEKRLLKYYKDVPVWNLTVWMDCDRYSKEGRAIYTGIEAHCHYKDIREGYLAERANIKRESRREYYKRKKMQAETAAMMEDMRTGGRFEMKEIIIAGQKYTEEDAKEILKLAKEFTKGDDSPEAKHLVENIEQNIKMHFEDKK